MVLILKHTHIEKSRERHSGAAYLCVRLRLCPRSTRFIVNSSSIFLFDWPLPRKVFDSPTSWRFALHLYHFNIKIAIVFPLHSKDWMNEKILPIFYNFLTFLIYMYFLDSWNVQLNSFVMDIAMSPPSDKCMPYLFVRKLYSQNDSMK